MEVDFVSEVDRKFFANNMLSNEDWDASMELSELMGLDDTNNLLTDLTDELQLPVGTDTLSFYSTSTAHDDLLNDWSDSSDSGVSGLVGAQSPASSCEVKSEPLSPASSHTSDSTDSGFSSFPDLFSPSQPAADVTKVESPDFYLAAPSSPQDLTSFLSSTTTDPTVNHNSVSQVISTISLPSNGAPNVNIHSILNSKVKIQPKPETLSEPASPQQVNPITPVSSSQKSIVLTPEEFQHLTSQGVLRFQPPKQESLIKPQVITKVPLSTPSHTQTVPVAMTNTMMIEDPGSKAMKRQQRMIKNRESASLSRKRKKEYMSTLEYRLNEFSTENEKLRQENLALKRKLSALHSENENLKGSFSVPPPLKKTCLMAVFLVLCLNLGSWSGITMTNQTELREKMQTSVVHKGRQLMAVPEIDDLSGPLPGHADTVDWLHKLILDYGGPGRMNLNLTDVPPMCPTYFNKTESMRLAEQLAGWMYRHEEEKKKVISSKKQEQHTRRQREKQLRPISTLKRAIRGGAGDIPSAVDRKYARSVTGKYQIQVFDGVDTGRDFLKSIHRRNDTFYVLSFDEDYYLVPAVFHNKTRRPRMSLVMPALVLNDSVMPPEDQVGMMQIDCEVMNTQLIHVQKSAIPRHMRERYNTSYTPSNDDRLYT